MMDGGTGSEGININRAGQHLMMGPQQMHVLRQSVPANPQHLLIGQPAMIDPSGDKSSKISMNSLQKSKDRIN